MKERKRKRMKEDGEGRKETRRDKSMLEVFLSHSYIHV